MGLDGRLTARTDTGLEQRVEAVADRYGMDQSKLIRLLVRDNLDRVEREGLDAVATPDDTGEEPQAATDGGAS